MEQRVYLMCSRKLCPISWHINGNKTSSVHTEERNLKNFLLQRTLSSFPAMMRLKGYQDALIVLCTFFSLLVVTMSQEMQILFGRGLFDEQFRNPHFKGNRSVIVHLVNWNFTDIADECEDFLGPTGFGGVQVSPVTNFSLTSGTNVFWERYQPVSYNLSSKAGDEESFADMVFRCNQAGIRVYIDVVLNHMGLIENNTNHEYPEVPYQKEDFHQDCDVQVNTNPHVIRNCQVFGSPDLDHSKAHVREALIKFLNKLIDLGVAGLHVFGAKYIWPIDLKNLYKDLKDLNESFGFPAQSKPYIVQDIMDLNWDGVSKTEYTSYGAVSEYQYALTLSDIMAGRLTLDSLINWGPEKGLVDHEDALVFVDDFYIQMLREVEEDFYEKRITKYFELLSLHTPAEYLKALTFMIIHPFGKAKRLVSTCQGRNECCLHQWKPLQDVVFFSELLNDEELPITNFQAAGVNQISFCRGDKAFFAYNNDFEEKFDSEVQTCLDEGTYCDVLTGGLSVDGTKCMGRALIVNGNGSAVMDLPSLQDDAVQLVCGENEFLNETIYSFLVIFAELKVMEPGENRNETAIVGEDFDLNVSDIVTGSTILDSFEVNFEASAKEVFNGNDSFEQESEDHTEVLRKENDLMDVTTIESTFSI